jgi:regulator of sigma E protease
VNPLVFLLLVSSIVLVHELGHFFVARALGVRVLTLSFGFGPTLIARRGPETTYRVGWLPLGGYVRLLERRDLERHPELPSALVNEAYDAQPLWRRTAITLAGPLMNVLVPLVVFFVVGLDARPMVPPLVGAIEPGSPAASALRPGDRVLEVEGHSIDAYGELAGAIAARADQPTRLVIARPVGSAFGPHTREERLELTLTPRARHVRGPGSGGGIGNERPTIGRLGIGPAPLAAVVGVVAGSAAARAGLATFDVITQIDGVPVRRWTDLEERLRKNPGTAVAIDYLRPSRVGFPDRSALAELAVLDAGVAIVAPDAANELRRDGLARLGIEPVDLYVSSVRERSPEAACGLAVGDRLLAVDGEPLPSFAALSESFEQVPQRARLLAFDHAGVRAECWLTPAQQRWSDESGHARSAVVLGIEHLVVTVPEPMTRPSAPVAHAANAAVQQTARIVRHLAHSASLLIRGRLDWRSVRGPLAIYDVAGRAGVRGTPELLWVMALVSINLGVLNLLPVPTLDGGQLVLIAFEAIVRRPLPLRARQIASAVGVALLGLASLLALWNDLLRP